MLRGTHELVRPEGDELALRVTVPLKPPVARREIVDVAD